MDNIHDRLLKVRAEMLYLYMCAILGENYARTNEFQAYNKQDESRV